MQGRPEHAPCSGILGQETRNTEHGTRNTRNTGDFFPRLKRRDFFQNFEWKFFVVFVETPAYLFLCQPWLLQNQPGALDA